MKIIKVLLNDVDKVKDFVHLVEKSEFICEIGDGNYFVDARSIIGIFSLDTSKTLELRIRKDDCQDLITIIDKYVVK